MRADKNSINYQVNLVILQEMANVIPMTRRERHCLRKRCIKAMNSNQIHGTSGKALTRSFIGCTYHCRSSSFLTSSTNEASHPAMAQISSISYPRSSIFLITVFVFSKVPSFLPSLLPLFSPTLSLSSINSSNAWHMLYSSSLILCQDLAQNKMRSSATKLLTENRPSHTFFRSR